MGPVLLWPRPGRCFTLSNDALSLTKLDAGLSRFLSADVDDVVQSANLESLNWHAKEGEEKSITITGWL